MNFVFLTDLTKMEAARKQEAARHSIKIKTLNAFYGHFRSFAHPKPYVKNYQRNEINNPELIFFRY